jgi:hypothetical protein
VPQPVYKDSRAESTLHGPQRTAVARERRIVREKRKRFHKSLRDQTREVGFRLVNVDDVQRFDLHCLVYLNQGFGTRGMPIVKAELLRKRRLREPELFACYLEPVAARSNRIVVFRKSR